MIVPSNKKPYNVNNPKRLIALDGGGIYGLTQAIWLKELCRRAPSFLNESDVDYYFVGCSAGGMNALILANQENPRDFIERDGLYEFWHDSGIYTNQRNPMDAWLSNFGLASWLGSEDYLRCCEKQFGNKTLRNLPHKVVITTFNWYGGKPPEKFDRLDVNKSSASSAQNPMEWYFNLVRQMVPPWHPWRLFGPADGNAGQESRPYSGSFFEEWFKSLGFPWAVRSGGQNTLPWYPMPFCNFDHMAYPHASALDELVDIDTLNESGYRAADVCYGVAAMPSIRAIRGGIGDAGVYSANPASGGISAVLQEAIAAKLQKDRRGRLGPKARKLLFKPTPPTGSDHSPRRRSQDCHHRLATEALQNIRMLSIGGGGLQPSFSYRNHNFGVLPWMLLQVNPAKAGRWKNADYNLNHVVADVTISSEALLFPHFHRLNPPVNPDPAGPLVLFIRNPVFRQFIIQQVESAARSSTALEALNKASQFIEDGEPDTEPWSLPKDWKLDPKGEVAPARSARNNF